ncbi:unnamed protein product, partial [Schistocephalus solidus]|uniref:Reverse transcriptase domain-containing protein n=1 Tax=Schistocephalus solidus TaxID=70667 RepID=A0A183T9P9_SCHSO
MLLANREPWKKRLKAINRWCHLRDTSQSTTLNILSRAHRQHQDWFDDNDLHNAFIDCPSAANKTAFYRRCRLDARMTRKADEIQSNADRNEWKNFLAATKAVYGPPKLSTGKAPGSDDFKDATIVNIHKIKGNRQLCDNPRGISLLNITSKIFGCILLNLLNAHLEQGLLPESQCGFRLHRGTIDMIFAARQLQGKCQEMRAHLYTTFVDIMNNFDTVNRNGLWKIMQKFGCPERFTHMVRQLHDGMVARVTDNGMVSEAFAVTNGVKQAALILSAMLTDAYREE